MAIQFKLAARRLPIILVKATVSSDATAKEVLAMIDTGATGCLVSPELAKELKMKSLKVHRREKSAQGIGGKVRIEFARARRIECDRAIAEMMKVGVMDLNVIQRQIKTKRKVDMILGYPFFKGRKLTIDYNRKTLSIR